MTVDFTIVSKPDHITFECPHCGCEAEIPFKDVDVPESWSDRWPEVICPTCDEPVQLGDWEYE